VRYVRRVEWSGKSVQTPKYLNQERNNRVFVEICKIAFCDLQGFRRLRNWRALRSSCKMEWKERLNAEISESGTIEQSICRNLKDCDLRFAVIVSKQKLACATFGV
jgi:hypothetical protein